MNDTVNTVSEILYITILKYISESQQSSLPWNN